jgi:uncharacterized protein YggE
MKGFAVFGGFALVAAAALLAVGCDSGDTYVSTSGFSGEGVSVSGTGSAFGEPDLATLTLGVDAQADTVAEARETAAAALAGVIDSVRANGVAEEDVQTVQFSINPVYSFVGERRTLEGYQVTNVISIQIRDIDDDPAKSSRIIDDAVTAGGDSAVVQGIYFSITDPTALEEEARRAAVEDAKTRAEQLAENAGVDLGEPVQISESGGFTPIFYAGERALGGGAASDTATPIQTGQLEVQIYVTLLYKIG